MYKIAKKVTVILLFMCMLVGYGTQVKAEDSVFIIQDVDIASQYASIWNVEEQTTLFEKNAHEQMYPASLTKIMSTLVALEQIDDLNTTITLGPEVFEGLFEAEASVAGYKIGDQAKLIDLLYGIMLPSGADAARAVAIYVAGSEEQYVTLMNEKAAELQLEHTHFVNTSGLHDDDHYSTAADLSLMLQVAMKNETFHTIFTTDRYESEDGSMVFHSTKSASTMMAGIVEPFIQGSKTGFTLEGGLCLASMMEVNGATYYVITGNAGNDPSTYQHIRDGYSIYSYLGNQFDYTNVFHASDQATMTPISYGKEKEVAAIVKEDVNILVKTGTSYMTEYLYEDAVTAPIEVDEVIGQVKITSPDLSISHTYDLYAAQSVARDWPSYLLHAWWFYLILAILFAFIGIFLIGKPRIVRFFHKQKRR